MRPHLVIPFFFLAASLGFSQALVYQNAPKAFLGFSFGSTTAEVTNALKQAGTAFQPGPPPGKDGIQRLTVPRQSLDKIEGVTVELVFARDHLYQISGTFVFQAEILKGLVDVLGGKYGTVKSQDGGYSYLWTFSAPKSGSGPDNPDFALVLKDDPISSKSITLAYVDHVVRRAAQGTSGVGGTDRAEATPSPTPPALNSASF
jgi:hypothetical protein